MPLWHIYTPEGVYSDDDKTAFARGITDIYERYGLPRFYVSVMFHELAPNAFFIGGEQTGDFVRISIDHIARQVEPSRRLSAMQSINKAIDPFVKDRGLRSEIHVDETPIDFWTIEGMKPPEPGSETEKLWAKENKASSYS